MLSATQAHDIVKDMGYDDLNELADAIQNRWSEIKRTTTIKFNRGENVSFKSKDGKTHTGVIVRVNQTTCGVMVNGITWKVSSTLLEKV